MNYRQYLFYIVLVALFSQSMAQNETYKEAISQKLPNSQRVEIEAIGYLKNVINFDIIINFLHCNQSLGWITVKQGIYQLIYDGRNRDTIIDHNFRCKTHNTVKTLPKNSCWLCHKQFRNNSYLGTHYLVKHSDQFPFRQTQMTEEYRKKSLLSIILREQIYQQISPKDLQILFTSELPQQDIYQFCLQLFNRKGISIKVAEEAKPGSRYWKFFQNSHQNDLCMIIALKMFAENPWANVARYVGLIFLCAGGLAMMVLLISWAKQRAREDKLSHRYKKY